jgi:predicted enzyme related to lactoylglutathione lyase
MLGGMFVRYSLRTTELEAARRFYAEAIGLALPEGAAEGIALEAWPLHERARALGVPPHWLGHVAVADAERTGARMVELGAERLGPTVRANGIVYVTLRDPCGAVMTVREATARSDAPIGWPQLHTADLERSWSVYSELFGDPPGGFRLFSWSAGGPAVGGMGNTARWAGVHPHWLFHLPVGDVDAAIERVRACGGTARAPVALPDGKRLAACEDPQGAAFGLVQDR